MKNAIRTILASGALLLVAACAPTTPRLDAQFGESTVLLRAQQTRDPDATQRNGDRPVDGVEAQAAANAVRRYQKSFAEPPPAVNIVNIGLGSSN